MVYIHLLGVQVYRLNSQRDIRLVAKMTSNILYSAPKD